MSNCPARRRTGRRIAKGEAGYAVLMAIFMVASLILIVTVATPSVLLQGRRQREDEAVWRGKQYVRAIRLYFQKNGKFPASLEDLAKAGPGDIHYLRKVYTDPMNRGDGTWRPIYMNPSGQLIGSVRYHTLQEMAAEQGIVVTAGALLPGAAPQQGTGQQPGTPQPGTPQAGTQQQGTQPAAAQAAGQGTSGGLSGLSALSSSTPGSSSSAGSQPTPIPLEAVDGPVMGGLVVGIGSKVKQPSVRVYEGGETYFKWEFIWNPLTAAAGQVGGATIPGNAAPTTGQRPNPAGAGSPNPVDIPPLN